MDHKKAKESQELTIYPASLKLKSGAPTCVDLFAGAGGLAVGFRKAGWNVIGGNDIDPDAGATFRLNFGEAVFFEGPVSSLTTEIVLRECGLVPGELDCLIGGPPCQSFSYNNHQRSEKNSRARLFEHYLRLVKGLKPKTLVMENVPGILTIGDGSVIQEIRTELKTLGYECVVKVLSAEEFGTPQVRRRVFIVGSRVGSPAEMIPAATHRSASKPGVKSDSNGKRLKRLVTVQNAIGDLPSIPNGGGELVSHRGSTKPFSGFQRESRKGTRKLFNHVCHGLTKVNLQRIIHVPEGGNWRDIPRDLLPAGMQRARLSDHTKRYGRLAKEGLASTILTKCDPHWGAYIHPTQDRTISVREAARLQGFPDCFLFAGSSLGRHYEQVGNAVPVPVAEAVATAAMTHVVGRKVKPKVRPNGESVVRVAA
ncbi:DNA cytosine methyltransferase [Mesorhizobium sp. BE184]|uniref:DNA cytosine methyltransferase n=1 Tax=Mesorhizobium sp. BE184 TaxID=2817714 RepID=UPI002862BE01|nr:DNA cytosine methyltransferase [Mesorhizobium sp. BE184]MDR7033257.1 DNA (cytosine-5)-methyltransferase 1 [Mesorhizobium sp. BE184]